MRDEISKMKIKQGFRERNITFKTFEQLYNLPMNSVSVSLTRRSPKTDERIASFLQILRTDLWPERYYLDGTSIPSSENVHQMSDEALNDLKEQQSAKPRKMIQRGWTRKQFRTAFKFQGYNSYRSIEEKFLLTHGSINAALTGRYPKVDEVIEKVVGVHRSILWPNRYLWNGAPISCVYGVTNLTDEQLLKLNRETCLVKTPVGISHP